jgi:hypothetical protein
MSTERLLKALARKTLKAANSIPVKIIPGSQVAPQLIGESWHYCTRGGSRIWHPSAYSKRGWGNMIYVRSTRRVEVGADWQGVA